MKRRYKEILFSLLLSTFTLSSFAQIVNWQTLDVDTDDRKSGFYPDMAIDDNGRIHISYWHKDLDKLYYAWKDISGNSWTRETVDSVGRNGFKSAIVLDDQNRPRIAYMSQEGSRAGIRYASRDAAGNWTTETLPADSVTVDYGDYGPTAPNVVTERMAPSIDLDLNVNGEPVIVFFHNWMESESFPDCISSSEYILKMYRAEKSGSQWAVNSFGEIPDKYNSCIAGPAPAPLPFGDRYGEYCQVFHTPDGKTHAATMSRYNNEVVLFTDQDTMWGLQTVDSLNRAVGPGWDWSQPYFTFEGVGHYVAPSGAVHLSYTTSLFYGQNFCCVPWICVMATAKIDTSGAITIQNLPGNNYRNYTSMTGIGEDTLLVAYTNLTDFNVSLMESFDGGQNWTDSEIYQGAPTGYTPVQVHDSTIFVLIFDSFSESLLLASKTLSDSIWDIEFINRSEQKGEYVTARFQAVNGDTVARMAYTDGFMDQLYYGTGSSNGNWVWNTTRIDSAGGPFRGLDLDTDANGDPCALYGSGPQLDLILAWQNAGNWQYDTVFAQAQARISRITVSPSDTLHIAYYNADSQKVYYGKKPKTGGVWSITEIDTSRGMGEFIDLALDANERPHISYYEDDSLRLKYAWFNGSTWSREAVYENPPYAAGKFNSIEVGLDGNPKIAFLDENTTLWLAEKNTSLSWEFTVVDSVDVFSLGRPIDLEIDKNGNPWIAYNTYINFDRVQIRYRDTTWRFISVSTAGQMANAFDFNIVDEDLYLFGKKNEVLNTGVAVKYLRRGLTVSSEEPESALAETSIRNFPNPFNGETTFELQLPRPGAYYLEIYDIQGRRAGQLLNGRQFNAGTHRINWDASGLEPGLYVYRLSGPDKPITNKLMIVR